MPGSTAGGTPAATLNGYPRGARIGETVQADGDHLSLRLLFAVPVGGSPTGAGELPAVTTFEPAAMRLGSGRVSCYCALPYPLCASFAQASLSVIVRLKTG